MLNMKVGSELKSHPGPGTVDIVFIVDKAHLIAVLRSSFLSMRRFGLYHFPERFRPLSKVYRYGSVEWKSANKCYYWMVFQ
jgi:hypothetical protein